MKDGLKQMTEEELDRVSGGEKNLQISEPWMGARLQGPLLLAGGR